MTVSRPDREPAPQPASPDLILQVGVGFWPSKVLLSAIEMGVFTELGRGPLAFETLRDRLGLHPRAARDFLDALVALGFLIRRDGAYANAPDADHFLDRGKASYIGAVLEMVNRRLYPFWGRLTEALRTGRPQNELRSGGATLFEALYADPARLREFLSAMTGFSRGTNAMIADLFPWADHRTFVDAGTAQGDLAVRVARAHRHLRGRGFDLPPVAPIFRDHVAANGLADRLSFVPGDFFADPLPKADVVLMSRVLHDWSLEQKKLLIRRAFEAVPKGGALVVCDSIIDDDRSANVFGLLMSLNMLIETHEGFDYTAAECSGWMREAGFTSTRVVPLAVPDSLVIGIR